MRRISLVDRRVMEQDNDFADSRIISSRVEGMISALQGRQVQLDANVSVGGPWVYQYAMGRPFIIRMGV